MFRFKQFTILQDRCAMKVGTDGVLLGAWAPINIAVPNLPFHILDIGTGTGLISLMIAQRINDASSNHTSFSIDALEIDPDTANQADENIASSPFSENIKIHISSLQNYKTNLQYTHIVSNPPFFVNSIKNPDAKRNTARHTDSLSFHDLIIHSHKLLSNNGIFSVIIPHDSAEVFIKIAESVGLHIYQFTHVFSTVESASPIRALLSFTKASNKPTDSLIEDNLTIEISRHVYTDEYIYLTRHFYLKM